MKKAILGITLSLATLLLLGACGTKAKESEKKPDGWDKIEKAKKLVIGIDDTFVPMGFRDEKDQIVGFDIDLAKAVTADLGIEAEFQPIEWSMKETELNNGTIDVIWNGYTINPERKEKVNFTKPYLKNTQVVVTLKKNNINKTADLKGKILGAQEGSSGATLVESQPDVLANLVKNQAAVLYPTFVETFLELNNGRLDAFIIDSVFAEYYIAKDDPSKYVIIPSEFAEENFGVGVRKTDTGLLDKLNDSFARLYKEGKTQEISKKWFGENRILN